MSINQVSSLSEQWDMQQAICVEICKKNKLPKIAHRKKKLKLSSSDVGKIKKKKNQKIPNEKFNLQSF